MNLSSQELETKPVSKVLKNIFSKMRTNIHVTDPELTNTFQLRKQFENPGLDETKPGANHLESNGPKNAQKKQKN